MSAYTYYQTSTGRILAAGYCEDGYEVYQYDSTGNSVLVGEIGDPDSQYVLGGSLAARPVMSSAIDVTSIQADGFDAATITGIPAGWSYEISNGASGVTDGTDVVLTALEPGAFTIKFTNWPYQDIEYTINASATPL